MWGQYTASPFSDLQALDAGAASLCMNRRLILEHKKENLFRLGLGAVSVGVQNSHTVQKDPLHRARFETLQLAFLLAEYCLEASRPLSPENSVA